MKCSFDPTFYKDEPLGMFHCPECGEMVLAGLPHPDYEETNMNKLIELLPETFALLKNQLESDEKRWGDTWKHRVTMGQEDRIFAELNNYYDQWRYGGVPIPWLKVLGLAHIALVRINHPEEIDEK